MRRILIMPLLLVGLYGCSEEVVNEESNDPIERDTQQQSETVEGTDLATLEEQKENQQPIQSQETKEDKGEVENNNNNNVSNDTEVTETKVDSTDILEEGLYTYYEGMSNDSNEENLEFKELDEATIELPTYENNEEVFKDRLTVVKVNELEQDVVLFFEEPISGGFLGIIDLEKLSEEYVGVSYSIRYNGIEYPVMVGDHDPTEGLAVVENVEDVEYLQEAEILVME